MSILVSLIGLSAVAAGRVNLRTAAANSDGADAELLALSAVEHAATSVNTESTWRTKFAHDAETSKVLLGRGSFTWKLVDPADGDLSAGGLQPVRVFGFGNVGEARRAYSVQLTPGGPNLLSNPGMESGTTGYTPFGGCTLESDTAERRGGTRSLRVKFRTDRFSGPQQDVTAQVASGRSYYCEAWVRMSGAVEDVYFCLVVQRSATTDPPFKVRGQRGTSAGGWAKMSGTLNPTWTGSFTGVSWWIETATTAQDFKVDDVKMVADGPGTPMVPSPETWRQEPLQ